MEKQYRVILIIAVIAFVVFGFIVPLWLFNTVTNHVNQAIQSYSEKTDKAIAEMQDQLKASSELQSRNTNESSEKINKNLQGIRGQLRELAGKPNLVCFYEDKNLEGTILKFTDAQQTLTLNLTNTGDVPGKNVRIRLYTVLNKQFWISSSTPSNWKYLDSSDEPNYSDAFEFTEVFSKMDAKESKPLTISIPTKNLKDIQALAMLKIYSDQPEPKKYFFAIRINE